MILFCKEPKCFIILQLYIWSLIKWFNLQPTISGTTKIQSIWNIFLLIQSCTSIIWDHIKIRLKNFMSKPLNSIYADTIRMDKCYWCLSVPSSWTCNSAKMWFLVSSNLWNRNKKTYLSRLWSDKISFLSLLIFVL
jgi:hypothetical protein